MQHFCTLNKRIMEAQRKSQAYATVLIDLVNLSIITKAQAEELLGYTIPSYLVTSGSDTSDPQVDASDSVDPSDASDSVDPSDETDSN